MEDRQECWDKSDFVKWIKKRGVRRRWRDVIDDMAKAWTVIVLPSSTSFLEFQIKRTKHLPLNATVYLTTNQQSHLDWLKTHGDSLGRLTIVMEETDQPILREVVSLACLVNLRSLVIKGAVEDPFSLDSPHNALIIPSGISDILISKVSIPLSSLSRCVNLRSLCFHGGYRPSNAESKKIALLDLRNVLPLLRLLEYLDLRTGLEIVPEGGRLQSPVTLSSLRSMTFVGRGFHFQHFLVSFSLPSTTHWTLRLRIESETIVSLARLRALTSKLCIVPNQVIMRWQSSDHIRVTLIGGETLEAAPFLALSLDVFDGTGPCRALVDLIGGDVVLAGVEHLRLDGGLRNLDVHEVDDDVIQQALRALPLVKEVEIQGNAGSWGRLPLVLRSMQLNGELALPCVWRLSLRNVSILPPVIADWIKYLGGRKKGNKALEILDLTRCILERSDRREREALETGMCELVTTVIGSLELRVRDCLLASLRIKAHRPPLFMQM